MRPFLAVGVLVLATLLGGCVGQDLPGAPNAGDLANLVPLPLVPIEVDHDHSLPAEHEGQANMKRVAYASGYGEGDASSLPANQGFSELSVRDGLAFLGRRGGPDGGFVIFDVSHPEAPKRLGAFNGLANYDVESTYDNKYVFYVSQYLNTQQPTSIPPRSPGDFPRGIHVVDITDRAQPQDVNFFLVPTRGAHTLTYFRTESGRELVAAQSYDFVPDPSLGLPAPNLGVSPAAERVLLFDFVRTPAPRLELLSTYEKHELPPLNDFFPHDVAIQKHPVTGQLLMYVAYWNLGAFIVDISDPAHPKDVARLTDFSPSKLSQVHLAAPAEGLIAGRHVTVTEPELGGASPETGQFTLFDTTDPAHPKRLGFWTLPGQIQNDVGTRFSPHNFEIEDGRLVLAHYHAGVWVVDVSTPERLMEPVALGYVQPNVARSNYEGDSSNVWTALYDHGLIYASDIATGLYVYHFAGDPMPAMDAGHAH
jgi:hypothetical protein